VSLLEEQKGISVVLATSGYFLDGELLTR
jgi:hypothetical protein